MIIQLTTGKCSVIPHRTAVRLWLVKNNERRGSRAEVEKAAKIRKFFFNPSTAPASWQRLHPPVLKQPAISGKGNSATRLPYKD